MRQITGTTQLGPAVPLNPGETITELRVRDGLVRVYTTDGCFVLSDRTQRWIKIKPADELNAYLAFRKERFAD